MNSTNYQINWHKLTEQEAQDIADKLCQHFNVVAKGYFRSERFDVAHLEVMGDYDDRFHGNHHASDAMDWLEDD